MEPRNQPQGRPISLRVIGIAIVVAAALGFSAARMMAPNVAAPVLTTSAPVTSSAVGPTKEAKPEVDGYAEIKIPAEYLKIAQIAVEAVGGGDIAAEMTSAGTVTASPGGEAVIQSRASGNVTRINRQLGDSVKAGDVLAQIDSLEAATMSAERSTTFARAELARKTYAREKSLFDQGVTPRQDVDTAQAALAVADAEARRATVVARAANLSKDGASIAVVSPIAGKVAAQSVTLGGFVQPQTELFRVAGKGKPLVEASVAAADVSRITVGARATIVPASGMSVEATVRSVTSTVAGASRAATVLLTPVSDGTTLVIGEGVQVRLHLGNGQSSGGMVVPEDAVQNLDGRDVLFVRTANGFRPTRVLVGARSGGVAQIIDGIKVDEQVATRNAFLIKADMIKADKE
ncbi:MAG: efflux RND transporter periplasmic adaptor subunit [Bdellovibrionales bacterium]|nr:efflux RND transporter periplasmic adaptor subunit [Massilia sp.]